MKLKQQDKMAETNGNDETINEEKISSSNMHITDEDKEKGNFKNFNISKKTIKKLKGKIKSFIENFQNKNLWFILDRNINFLFPVQAESYKYIHDQKDCIVQAYTGTGKTLAFSIPIIELLQNDTSVKLLRGRAPRVLALAPTRELSKF